MPSASLTLNRALADGFRPEPDLLVSEWADGYRQLDGRSSAEPGQWRTSRTPYLREPMDSLSTSSPVQRVVVMKAVQLGFTEGGLNWIGYIIQHAPAPTLVLYPTKDIAASVSKTRIAPMIEATPVLRGRISPARSRDSGNTVLEKDFQGGGLFLVGSNSPALLATRPIRNFMADELDRLGAYTGDEGDPVSIAEKRTDTFTYLRKIYLVSTPTVRGLSRIEREFNRGDKRRYFVPCPRCDATDYLRWENIRWEEGRPDTAKLACVHCGELLEEKYKPWMLEHGEWRPTAVGDSATRSYHISGFYSPWISWVEIVEEFLKAKEDPSKLQVWVNTRLGESWEDRTEAADAETVFGRCERYAAEVPSGVGVLVASVDVQKNRLECQVKGYGAQEESWLITWETFLGDTQQDAVWYELDRFLRKPFLHESGRKLWIQFAFVDSGYRAEKVYQFCKAREGRRVFACRGGNEIGKPVVGPPSNRNRHRALLFTLCTDTAKDIVYARLRIPRPESGAPTAGYMHLPEGLDREYVEQLTAEVKLRKNIGGRIVPYWKKTRERNEALDLEVMSLAALYAGGQPLIRSLPERAAALAKPASNPAGTQAEEPPSAPPPSRLVRRPGRSWVNRWRR